MGIASASSSADDCVVNPQIDLAHLEAGRLEGEVEEHNILSSGKLELGLEPKGLSTAYTNATGFTLVDRAACDRDWVHIREFESTSLHHPVRQFR
jgi:hypothetical protein